MTAEPQPIAGWLETADGQYAGYYTREPTEPERQGRPLPGEAEAYYAHKECGGTTIWDLSGGFCTRCHAEGLDADDVGPREVAASCRDGACACGQENCRG